MSEAWKKHADDCPTKMSRGMMRGCSCGALTLSEPKSGPSMLKISNPDNIARSLLEITQRGAVLVADDMDDNETQYVITVLGDELVRAEQERDMLAAALLEAKIPHRRVEDDPWFTCPLAWREDNEGWATTCFRCDGKPCIHGCNCDAEEHNEKIDRALRTSQGAG